MLVAAFNGEGFIKVVGEVGHGKTLLCRTFLSALENVDDVQGDASYLRLLRGRKRSYLTAFIPNPYLDPRGLLLALAEEFSVKINRSADLHTIIESLKSALLEIARIGKNALVCLDEVQAMPQVTLEMVRLLTNLETEKRKLLQVVLFGQPELDVKLNQQSSRQLLQRITFQLNLTGLRRDEIGPYLDHRLRIAGYPNNGLFTPAAVKMLYRYSGGTPRLVNVIAHKALMVAYGEGAVEIGPRQVKVAADDTPAARHPKGILAWFGQ